VGQLPLPFLEQFGLDSLRRNVEGYPMKPETLLPLIGVIVGRSLKTVFDYLT
jgi:hypothetical protein